MTRPAGGGDDLDALFFRAEGPSDEWSGHVLVSSRPALELLHDAGLHRGHVASIAPASLVALLRPMVGRERGRSPQDVVALLRLAVAAADRNLELQVSPADRSRGARS